MAGVAGMGNPESIKSPVPNTVDLNNIAQVPDIKSMKIEPPPAEDELDSEIASFAGEGIDQDIASFAQGISSDEATLSQEIEASQEVSPGFLEQVGMIAKDLSAPGQIPLKLLSGEPLASQKLFEDAGTRLKASFGKTDKEKRFVLDKAYGSENVKKAKDGFLVKKEGKWKKFDKDNFELIGDLLDVGGDIVEQGITEAATAGGLALATGEAAAAPLTGGASFLAMPGTVAASRAAGAVAGTGARDLIAQGLLDIPRDEDRSAVSEYGVNAALNTVGGRIADWAGGKMLARSAAKEANKLMSPSELFAKELALTDEASKVLKESGLYNQELSLIEQVPNSKEAKALFQKIANDPNVEQVFKMKNDAMAEANKNFLDSISSFSGNKPGVGKKVADYIDDARKAEGKLIGDYRQRFLKEAGDGELPVPELQSKIDQIAQNLGFQVKDNRIVKPTIEQLEELGYSKEGATNLSRLVEGLNEKIFNQEGRLNAKQINGLYDQWSKLTDNLYSRGEGADKAYRRTATQIKDSIRDTFTDKIGVVLDGDQGYKKALSEFSFIEKNRSKIEDILDKDKIGSMAFAKHIFSKGQNGLDDLVAAKSVLKNRPDLFDELTGQFYSDIVSKNTDKGTGNVSWSKVNKEISSLGPEMLEVMMGKDAMKQLSALEVIGTNLEKASKMGGLTAPQDASIVKNMAIAVQSGSPFASANAFVQSLSQMDNNKILQSVLKKEGIDNFLKTAPKEKRSLLNKLLNAFVESGSAVLTSPAAQAVGRANVQEKVVEKNEKRKSP